VRYKKKRSKDMKRKTEIEQDEKISMHVIYLNSNGENRK
jgi:hypothetical protein